jgi:hypothetical protein
MKTQDKIFMILREEFLDMAQKAQSKRKEKKKNWLH